MAGITRPLLTALLGAFSVGCAGMNSTEQRLLSGGAIVDQVEKSHGRY